MNEEKLKDDLSKLASGEEQVETTQEKEYSEVEKKAMERGWNPDYDGPEDEFVDAKEFLGRQPLYDAIHESNRRVKKLEEQLTTLKDWHDKTEKTAYEKALKELKQAKNDAIKAEDALAAIQIDERIRETEKQAPKPVDTGADKTAHNKEVFDKFLTENPWYNEDVQLKRYATGVGFSIEQEHPDWDIADILKEVTKEVKERFPDKFSRRSTTKVVKTNSTTTSGAPKKDGLMKYEDLDENGKKIYNKLVKTGVLTHEQYMKDYKAHRG